MNNVLNVSENDLWGEAVPTNVEADNNLPVRILKEQAALLENKTNGILRGEVQFYFLSSQASIYSFVVFAPKIGREGIRFTLFKVEQPVSARIFPVYFDDYFDKDEDNYDVASYLEAGDEYPGEFYDKDRTVHNLEQFKTKLKEILTSKRTKEILSDMMVQSLEFAKAA